MGFREFFLENFAGDLEYHPRRAAIYFVLAAGAAGFWIFSPAVYKFTTVPLVFALGGLALLGKGIYLLRPSSEGIGLSHTEVVALTTSAKRKTLPSLPAQVAQIVQDFGLGGLLLCPLLGFGPDINSDWSAPPSERVFLVGAFFFALGWVIRRYTQRDRTPGLEP